MKNFQREDIHLVSQHSNLSEQGLENALKQTVYNDKQAWQKFLQLLFITLGVGFTVAGIVFFFAYNWADLHKFAKIGLVETLLIIITGLVLLPKIHTNISNIILTGASVLVGVLFAVFGQIYQTGANAYDFFLGWTVFVTLWVIISNFAPLWLLYLVLINTTFILYSQQVAQDWSGIFILTSLFVINAIATISTLLLSKYVKSANIPYWFSHTLALVATIFATFGIITGIFDKYELTFPILLLMTAIVFVLGVMHGLRTKSVFYLSIIAFSLITIISAWIINISEIDREGIFLIISLFIIGSVTLVIKNLMAIQKKWKDEK